MSESNDHIGVRLAKIETIQGEHGKLMGCILDKIEALCRSNGCQTADIAVLKTKAAMYGAIGALVAAPVYVGLIVAVALYAMR